MTTDNSPSSAPPVLHASEGFSPPKGGAVTRTVPFHMQSDPEVDRPKHYQSPFKTLAGAYIQALDVIVAWQLGFNLGNTVKYILRSGKKDPQKYIQDLKKARYYLDTEIKLLEEQHYTNEE